jgi:hypothetical protein
MLVVVVVLPGGQGESFKLWNDIWEGTDERWENTQDVNHCMDVGTGMYGQKGERGEPTSLALRSKSQNGWLCRCIATGGWDQNGAANCSFHMHCVKNHIRNSELFVQYVHT